MNYNSLKFLFILLAVVVVFSWSPPLFAWGAPCTGKLKLRGDFRLRYQWQDETHKDARNRERIRLRLGATVEVSNYWKVGFGLATGGSDPRSTNQTLDDAFSTPDLRLDHAYALFSPADGISIWGGKFSGIKRALWRPTDLLWDSDLRPEGIGAKVFIRAGGVDLFGNLALFILDEVEDGKDPLMFIIQPGVKVSVLDDAYVKAAFSYYPTRNVKGVSFDHSANTNTLITVETGSDKSIDVLAFDYNSFEAVLEIGLDDFPGALVKHVSLFGGFVANSGADSLNTGYSAGIKLGYVKVSKSRQWLLKYVRRHLEKDAWLDIFPDSDAYGGRTDVRGDEVILEIGLADNIVLSLDYYSMERIVGKGTEDLLQLDLLLKF